MQSRNGESSRLGNAPGGDAVHADSPHDQQVNGLVPGPRPGQSGQSGQPARPEPPDRPRPREPGPPPPVPSKLPKRTPDASRPSVPSKLYRRPGPPGAPKPPEPSSGPDPPPGQPGPPPGQPGAAEPVSQPGPVSQPEPVRPAAPEPSWSTVLATTVRLSAQRRLGWVRRLWPAQTRWRVVAVATLVAVVFVAGAATVRLSGGGGQDGRTAARQAGDGALTAAAAARQQAAAWVASQVNADAIVACDVAMCAALQARGVPAARLLMLSPVRADPLGSDLVVATPAVRSQFGARLAGVYAPVTLAVFGSGAARIDVRAVAADGAAAYRAELAADVRARKAAGAMLLRNHHIHASAGARAALAAGEVDARLLATLVTLATVHPLDIVGFGSPGPGAGAGVPLRSAEITGAPVAGPRHAASLSSLAAILRAQRPPYLPSSMTTLRTSPGVAVLRIEYPVPSPLGLLGSGN
jgi:hypothetical protein